MGEIVEELCRLCAGFDQVKMPIFSTEGRQRNLVNKIQTCLRFRVTEEDGFPSSVCYKCMFNLENFFDFYETSLRAQSALHAKIVETGGKAELVIPMIASQLTRLVNKDEQQTDASSSSSPPPPPPPLPPPPPPLSNQQGYHPPTAGIPNVDRPFPCDLCPTSFISAKDRWTHVSQNHKGDARITCIFCRKGFSTISNLNFHKKNKHAEELEEWEKKPKPLPKLQKINDISKNKTYETVRNFLNNKTETMLQDARHPDLANFNVKIGNTDIKFSGQTRGVENRSMIDRLKNLGVEVSTGNVKNNQLGYEDKYQNPEDLLELDLALESGENLENMIESETVFGCEVCLRDFKDRSSLWLHMLYSHKNEAGYTCGMCLKLCTSFHQLQEHVTSCKEMNESEKRRYYCNICYRQHESKKKLETHTMIHNLSDPWLMENLDMTNLISSNPTATEKAKMEEAEGMDTSELSDTYGPEMDSTNDSTQNNQQHSHLNRQDQLAYQSFLESSGHFLESSAFFDDVKAEPESKLDGPSDDGTHKFRCDECFRTYDTILQLQKHKYNVHKNPNRIMSRNDSFGNPVYECEFCGETYDTAKLLMKHRYNVHRNPNMAGFSGEEVLRLGFQCADCPRQFETPRQLQKHRYNVHKSGRKMIPGNNGNGGGESPSSVDSFKPTYHYSYSFDCEICGERLASKTERWKHCFKEHREDPRLLCDTPDCKKVMPTESFKKEHQTFHEQQGKFPICCEICAKLWSNKVEFWKHVSGVHYSLIGLTCGVCMKMFLQLDELKEHVKSHEPLSESEFNCDICGRGYSSRPKMTRHRLIHEHDHDADEYNILKHTLLKGGAKGPTILNIPKVNRNFENEMMEVIEVNPDDGLHDGEHEEGVPDHLWCDVCPDLSFADLDELRTHRRNIHALYPCDLCPKFYGGVSHLWKHTNRSHKNHPDITCKVCGKTSASRVQLRGHVNKNHKEVLLGHTVGDGIDPDPTNLNCQRCGKEFRIRSLVRRHERTCLLKETFDPDPTNLHCQKCGKYYAIRSLVRRHEKICLNRNTEPLSLNCNVCGKEFPKRSYCRRHERTCGMKKERPPKEEGPASYQCEWCPKLFTNRRAYVGHVDYMHSIVECEVCTEERVTYRSKVDLYNHCKAKHGNHPDLLCPHDKCGRLLRSKSDLEKHARDHKNRDSPPTCEFCADVFKGRKKLRIHILHQHRMENGRKFICGICVKVLDDTPSLIAHIHEAHSKLVERDFTCRICARPYNCNAKVLEHIKNTHDDVYKPCKHCLKVFNDDKELEEHVREHLLKDSNQCSICQEVFESVIALHEHVKSEHQNLRENSCLICGKKYHSAYTCFEHMDNKHGGVYVCCRKCSALFTSPDERAKHMETHEAVEEETQLTCTRCNTKNDNEEELEAHIKKDHAELFEEFAERDMCLICSKVLKYKYSLWVHMSKHHKSVFGCRTCLMVYYDKESLDAHTAKLHTRDKDGNPPLFSPGNVFKNVKSSSAKKPIKNQCQICQTSFEQTEQLREHVAAKHPEVVDNEAICSICGHSYSSRFKVYYHITTAHGEPYKCCRKCSLIFTSVEDLQTHSETHPEDEPKPKRKRKEPDEEEAALATEKRERPRRSRSKTFANYVTDLGEVDEDVEEEEGEEEEDEDEEEIDEVGASPETEEAIVDPNVPSEDDEDDEEVSDEDNMDEDEEEDDEDENENENVKDEEEEDEEDVDDSEDDDEPLGSAKKYRGKIEAKVGLDVEDDEDNYTCEPVSDDKGDDKFKLKIKHNISSFKKEDNEESVDDTRLRKRKRGDVVNGTEDENPKRLMTDRLACVAE